MSRSATCPKCGGRITVPGGFTGAQIFCPECGAGFRLRAPAPKVRPAAPPPPPPSITDDDLPTDANGVPQYPCAMCGGSFPPERVYDANGLVLCHDCHTRSVAADPAPPVDAGATAAAPCTPGPAARRAPLLLAGVTIALALGAGAVLIARLRQQAAAPVAAVDESRVKLRDFSTLTAPPREAPSVGRQINAAWREAKVSADRGDWAAADAKYGQLFDILESQTGQPGYRSYANDLVAARREWDTVRGRLGNGAPPAPPAAAAPAPASNPPAAPPVAAATTGADATPPASPTVPTVRAAAPKSPRRALDETRVLELLTAAGKAARAGQKLNAALLYKQAYDLIGSSGDEPRSDALQTALVSAAAIRRALLAEVKELPETRDLALAALLTRGNAALATEHWQAGLEALADARQAVEEHTRVAERLRDDRYVQTLHGMAVAYLRMNDVPRAGDLFDDRSPLGHAVKDRLDARQRGTANRDLLFNRAVVDMIQKYNVLRAVRGVRDYLAAQDKVAPVDEEMLDLLGTAIHLATEANRENEDNKLVKEAQTLYAEQRKRLEATRPGQRRWGAEWRPAAEVAKLVAEQRRALAAVQTARRDLDAAQRQLATAKKGHLPRGGVGMQFFVVNPAEVKAAEGQVSAAKERLAIARAAVPPEPWKPRPEPTLPAAAYAMAHPAPVKAAAPAAVAAATGAPPGHGTATTAAPPPQIASDAPPPGATEMVVAAPASPAPLVQRNAVAFAVGRTHLVTAADIAGDAESVRLEDADGDSFPARVVAKQGSLALLEVTARDLPAGGLPALALAVDFRGGPVRCAAIPSASLFLPTIAVLNGKAAPPSPQGAWQVSLERHPRLPGAPLLDATGKVVGVVTARRDAPATQLPAATLADLRAFLQGAGALPPAAGATPAGDPTHPYHVVVEQ